MKYAIRQKKFEILRMLKIILGKTDKNDESESDDDEDDKSESHYDGYEILKKLAPTAIDSESESDDDDSDDESNSESENDDVDKENGSKPYNPYIEHYVKQAQGNHTGNFVVL